MITELERRQIWNKFYNVNRCARYFEELAGIYQLANHFLRFMLLLPLFGGIALFLKLLPEEVQIYIGAGIAILVALEMSFNVSKNATVLHLISVECSKLEEEIQKLWLDANSENIDREILMARYIELSHKLVDITCKSDDALIYKFKRLNKKCGEAAYKDLIERF